MINILTVGAGGFIGAILRYGLGQACKTLFGSINFPVGTFAANLIGAFVIGAAFQFFMKTDSMGGTLQLFVMVGLLGGFTTFSSFSLETVNLMASGKFSTAAVYVILSVSLCLLGVWLGKTVAGA